MLCLLGHSFHAEELQLMSTVCELQLKPPLECIDIFIVLKEKVDLISKVTHSLCAVSPIRTQVLSVH